MAIIILKIILCSTLLIALYYLFLEKEKMYRFNRFFLISSLTFSFIAPFISIKTEFSKPVHSPLIFGETTQQILDLTPKQESFNWMNLIWLVYGIITVILLFKGIISIIQIKKIKGRKIFYQNHNIILTKEHLSPFTFWKTIYLGENYLIGNTIDSRIFVHEKSHLEQKHSIDLLFIELLKIFMWFNPSLYFYKKAMIVNHEFLADEEVLNHDFNIKEYQKLILNEIISSQNYNLTHTFNFNNTKKRFIMMNRKKSKLIGIKKAISIPVLVIAFGLFVQKTYANNTNLVIPKILKAKKTQPTETSQETIQNAKELIENNEVKHTNDEKEILDTIRPKNKQSAEEVQTITEAKSITSESNETFINPEYPGGMNQLRTKIANTFDGSKINPSATKELLKSEINYIIDESGNVTNIVIKGNNENFNNEIKAAFLRANDGVKWKPATKNGAITSYAMRLPMTMSFQ